MVNNFTSSHTNLEEKKKIIRIIIIYKINYFILRSRQTQMTKVRRYIRGNSVEVYKRSDTFSVGFKK